MNTQKTDHDHCWHAYRGPIWMVIPDGHVLQKCCKCSATRMIHIDHAHGHNYWGKARWVYDGHQYDSTCVSDTSR